MNKPLIIALIISLFIHFGILLQPQTSNIKLQKDSLGEISISIGQMEPRREEQVPQHAGSDLSGKIKDSYLAKIRQRIARFKKYPTLAKTKSLEGSPKLNFWVLKDGEINQLKLTKASKHKILNQEAIATINRAVPFPKIPKELNTEKIEVSLVLTYKLD